MKNGLGRKNGDGYPAIPSRVLNINAFCSKGNRNYVAGIQFDHLVQAAYYECSGDGGP